MITSLSPTNLTAHVVAQLHGYSPADGKSWSAGSVSGFTKTALERMEKCVSGMALKGFRRDGQPAFDHLHTDQYAMFLYFLCNSVHRAEGDPRLAAAVYGLNKALHGIDVFYEVELPDYFAVQHPVGTVLGRATYSDYFLAYQRVTVGSTLSGAAPTFGRGVVLFGGSSVVGGCAIGDNVFVSTGAVLLDEKVATGSVVFGQTPHAIVKPTKRDVARDIFGAAP